MEDVLVPVMVVGMLFVAFLWSGGFWEYKEIGNYPFRMNKITGEVQVSRGIDEGWSSVGGK